MAAIETYGKAKQQWLETFLDLTHGIPSHDTFGRVFAAIDPQQFHECFSRWIERLTAKLDITVINIDGKTTRGSYDRTNQLKALHTVSAWAGEHHLLLAQQRVEGKSNEITAIPVLLNLLDIKGATEVCFYMSSLSMEAEAMAKLIRSHWGIENSCHWVLDVVFGEDDSRVRTGHAAETMGLLRRLSLNLLKREPSKQSLRMKRYRAAMDNDFALALLAGEQGC